MKNIFDFTTAEMKQISEIPSPNMLNTDQARHFAGHDLVQTVCKIYLQKKILETVLTLKCVTKLYVTCRLPLISLGQCIYLALKVLAMPLHHQVILNVSVHFQPLQYFFFVN